MERRKPRSSRERGGLYIKEEPSSNLQLIRSGSTMLDLVLSGTTQGAWPLGRMSNVIGDNSTGKTLLAIEACANFAKQFPKGKIFYRETEAAFDEEYAAGLGLPLDRVDFGPEGIETQWNTVEDIFEDISECVEGKHESLYIVDSLDALSDRAELGRKIDEGSYAMGKQKKLHQLFRQRVRDIKKSKMHLMIVSQTRVKIGVMFGEKTTCSGGSSLEFYASQRVKLAKVKQLKVSRKGQDHAVGVRIRAKCTKNKIGSPYRECEFDLRFGFGINDAAASLEFLIACDRTNEVDESLNKAKAQKLLKYLEKLDHEAHREWKKSIRAAVGRVWHDVQSEIKPTWGKYDD